MKHDFPLVKRFATLRIPFWVKLFPMFGNCALFNVYTSWFAKVDDKALFWRTYW